VENAALLPWLTATAFIHSSMVAERRGSLRIWSSALVIATFVLTILGTFLTRSGVVASIHSFTASSIGPWFLGAILVSLGVSLALLLWRLPDLAGGGRPSQVVSRESAFLFNNVLFLGLTFAVLFGTLLPLWVEAFGGDKISVGAPWFNRVNVPIFIALLFLMGVGPALPWGRASWATLRERFAIPLLAAVAVTGVAFALGMRAPAPLATLGHHARRVGERRAGSRALAVRSSPGCSLAARHAQPTPLRRLRGAPGGADHGRGRLGERDALQREHHHAPHGAER
jgi:cytochrome c-type biogenesis protein CcmF